MSSTTPPGGFSVPPPAAGAAPQRPGTVTTSSMLLYLLAFLQLVSMGLVIYTATLLDRDKIEQIYLDNGASPDMAETAAAGASIGVYFGAALPLIFGVVYLILAIFVGKGKQWARITTWVWAGLVGVCCGLANFAAQGITSSLSGMGGGTGDGDQAAIQEDLANLAPGWTEAVSMVLVGVSLLSAIVVIILLALPPSNPFFRKPETQWTPPTYPAP